MLKLAVTFLQLSIGIGFFMKVSSNIVLLVLSPKLTPNDNVGSCVFLPKDTLKAFDDFKKQAKKCVKSCFSCPSDKINGTKNAFFFLSRAPTDQSSFFNLPFLYETKHKVLLPKTVCGIFHFRFRFVFFKVFILFIKIHRLFDFKGERK